MITIEYNWKDLFIWGNIPDDIKPRMFIEGQNITLTKLKTGTPCDIYDSGIWTFAVPHAGNGYYFACYRYNKSWMLLRDRTFKWGCNAKKCDTAYIIPTL